MAELTYTEPVASTLELFYQERRKADRQDLIARLRGRDEDLLPFARLASILQAYQRIPSQQQEMIPLDKIVGSVGRYRDFTRDFRPRRNVSPARWASVFRAITSLEGVPPIEVFRLGGVYFVVDGNHRVSVARASGFKDIAAFVTDIPVAADLETGDSLDAAIIKAEHARFLVETRLSDRFGDVSDIRFTKPGGYGKLLEHIEGHRYFMGLDHPEMGPVDFAQAAEDWYTRIYRPIVAAIERRRLLQQLPDSTAADLYVCVSAEILAAAQECGQDLTPDEAAAKLEPSASAWSRAIRDIMRMLTEIGDTLTDASAGIPPWAGQTLEWGDFAPPHAPLPTIVTEDRHDE